jgi:hypothetical protein
MVNLCKGNCGNQAVYKGWCKTKWISGNKFGVACPTIIFKISSSISRFRLNEARLGGNPMQNPATCAKNHSSERNNKTSRSLKLLGEKGLLPQQKEGSDLKYRRRKMISLRLKQLFMEGKHPRQLEGYEKRRERLNKMAQSLSRLGSLGKLPVQNMDLERKRIFGEKISRSLREGVASGRIKLSRSWKRIPYGKYFLRSGWENSMAEFLDKHQLYWEYESLRIPYWDTERNLTATTIPDFYIPKLNLIIEVKSDAKFEASQTIDKINSIKSNGYKVLLIGRKEINLIKRNEEVLFSQITSL